MSNTTMNGFLEQHHVSAFKPLAFYDKHLDCIRVIIRDCSVTEVRISGLLTLLEDNYPEIGQSQHVGFTIKGVKYLFAELGMPLEGILKITDILDAIVRKFPKELVNSVVDKFQTLLRETELEVDFAEAA